MLLSSFLGSSLGLLLLQFIKSVDVVERLAVIIGTASGFLVGVYMPIGSLPSFAQNVVKLTPGAYVAAAYRRSAEAPAAPQPPVCCLNHAMRERSPHG